MTVCVDSVAAEQMVVGPAKVGPPLAVLRPKADLEELVSFVVVGNEGPIHDVFRKASAVGLMGARMPRFVGRAVGHYHARVR